MHPSHKASERPWIIVGAGGHGAAVAEVLSAQGAKIAGFVDQLRAPEGTRLGFAIISAMPIDHIADGHPIALAVGDNYRREQLSHHLSGLGATPDHFPAVAHPSASVSQFAVIEPGTVILQSASVGPAASVGRFCVVATGAVVAHDAVMKDFSFVSANAVLGAAVLGQRSFIGIGGVVSPGSRIGSDVVVGAQSLVRGEFEDGVVAHGIPARSQRARAVGEPYLG